MATRYQREVIRIRKSKNRQHNAQKEKEKGQNEKQRSIKLQFGFNPYFRKTFGLFVCSYCLLVSSSNGVFVSGPTLYWKVFVYM
jgi:hypothetical protein